MKLLFLLTLVAPTALAWDPTPSIESFFKDVRYQAAATLRGLEEEDLILISEESRAWVWNRRFIIATDIDEAPYHVISEKETREMKARGVEQKFCAMTGTKRFDVVYLEEDACKKLKFTPKLGVETVFHEALHHQGLGTEYEPFIDGLSGQLARIWKTRADPYSDLAKLICQGMKPSKYETLCVALSNHLTYRNRRALEFCDAHRGGRQRLACVAIVANADFNESALSVCGKFSTDAGEDLASSPIIDCLAAIRHREFAPAEIVRACEEMGSPAQVSRCFAELGSPANPQPQLLRFVHVTEGTHRELDRRLEAAARNECRSKRYSSYNWILRRNPWATGFYCGFDLQQEGHRYHCLDAFACFENGAVSWKYEPLDRGDRRT